MIVFKEEWRKTCGVYVIKNIINNKIYIGSSINLLKRLMDHINLLTKDKHPNKHLQNSWNLYGKENFEIDIIEYVDINLGNEHLRDRETYWIRFKKSYEYSFGYNNIPGGIGTLGLPCSDQKKQKISQSNTGRSAWNKGISPTKDQLKKLKKNKRKKGKLIDVYDSYGNFIETIQSQIAVIEKYKSSKETINRSCLNKDEFIKVAGEYIYRYHKDQLKVKYLVLIDNNSGKEILRSLGINKIFSYIRNNNISISKSFEKKLRKLFKNSKIEFTEIINKYSINCKIARNDSNIINESRQP